MTDRRVPVAALVVSGLATLAVGKRRAEQTTPRGEDRHD